MSHKMLRPFIVKVSILGKFSLYRLLNEEVIINTHLKYSNMFSVLDKFDENWK